MITHCLTMSEGAVDLTRSDEEAGKAVKQEVKPEADEAGFQGAYDCLMCFTSCRLQPALHCTACTCNPWHVSCAAGTQFARVCPQCARASVAPWTRGRFTTLQHSTACVDLAAEEEAAEERQREREREESRKRELEERQRELDREEERKRELERAREEEKERARAREDATRREQERAREEEERNRQREEEREEEERKRSRARERGRVDRSAADQREERGMRDAKRWQTAHSGAATDDEDEADEHLRSTKYEDEFIAVLRQSAAGKKKEALLLLQRISHEQQQQQQQQPHLPAFAGAKGKGKAAARPPLPSAPEARGSGGACPLSSYLKTAADTAECMDMGNDIHGAYVVNEASPIKTDPGRRRGDIARIKKLSRDKLHKTVMR